MCERKRTSAGSCVLMTRSWAVGTRSTLRSRALHLLTRDFVTRCWALSEQRVDLTDLVVDLPRAGPATRKDRDVAGGHLDSRAVIRLHGHPAGDEVDRFVLLEQPARGAGLALPDTDRHVAVLPEGDAPGRHGRAGGLLQR